MIKLIVGEKVMDITSNSEMGNIDENVPVITEGNDLKIAFNAKYILDVLKIIDDSEISLRFNTAVSPCVLRTEGSNKYEFLILPVQMRE